MPFGQSVTTVIADLFPNDPVAPQVTGDFAQAFPTDPLEANKGFAVSSSVQDLFPTDPVHATELGPALVEFMDLLGPDLGDGFLL